MRKLPLAALSIVLALGAMSAGGAPPQKLRIGQSVSTLSFLPLLAARALGTFPQQGLEPRFVLARGGDAAVLAALDAGDIDFAAVGADTTLQAMSKGQPFIFIYALMSSVTLELVMSDAGLRRAGVGPKDPLTRRLTALRGATIGVSAVGGTQDRTLRWLAARSALMPRRDFKIAMIGTPPAIHAALEHGQIDGFLLSPPEGAIAEQAGTGRIVLRLGAEFAELRSLPYLVLVARQPLNPGQRALAIGLARVLQSAAAAVHENAAVVAGKIHDQFYPSLDAAMLLAAIRSLSGAVSADGRMSSADIDRLIAFASVTDPAAANLARELRHPERFWTNGIVEGALRGEPRELMPSAVAGPRRGAVPSP